MDEHFLSCHYGEKFEREILLYNSKPSRIPSKNQLPINRNLVVYIRHFCSLLASYGRC